MSPRLIALQCCLLLQACSSSPAQSGQNSPSPATGTASASTDSSAPNTAPSRTPETSVTEDAGTSDETATATAVQTAVNNTPPSGSGNFAGSCQYTYGGVLQSCDDDYSTSSSYSISQDCVSDDTSDPSYVVKVSQSHCPTTSIRESCSPDVETEGAASVTYMTVFYTAAPPTDTCASLATETATATGN